MGLPNINIVFKSKGISAIERSGRGVVALIIKDSTEGALDEKIYKSISDVDFTKIKERNYDYLKLVYLGSPSKVIVVNIGDSGTVNDALRKLVNLKFNYLCMPEASEEETLILSAWIKEQRMKQKTFKAVLANSRSDSEGIINFTTRDILSSVSRKVFTTVEYTSRIAGLLAGLPLSRSATFFVLDDIISIAAHEDNDGAINKGEFIVVFDGENHKVGRGVNSFTGFTTEKGKDFSKIKIIEGMDLYNDDIRSTFEDYYVGKYRNDYDNKQAFVGAINAYNKSLEGDVLDKSFDNISQIDVEAQRAFLEKQGINTEKLDEMKIKSYNTGSNVFIRGNIKFIDAMEDLDIVNHL